MVGEAKKNYYSSDLMFKTNIENIRIFCAENFFAGMHRQDFFEINIVTRGHGKHYMESTCMDANKGDVFIIPPDVKHGYEGGEGFDVFHILVHDRFIKKNMTDLQIIPSFFALFTAEPLVRTKVKKPLHLSLFPEQFDEIYCVLIDALKYPDSYNLSDVFVRNSYGMILITLLCKVYTENISSNAYEPNDDMAFMRVLSTIYEKYNEKLTISDLAKQANLSRSMFIQKFKEICKMSPGEYILERRLDVAQYMLLNTGHSLSEIAFRTGFYDSAHFSRLFFKKNGISPSLYRKNNVKY